jgi:hypothetical protein
MYIYHRLKYPLFLSDFDKTLIFLDSFSKNTHISNFVKIRPVVAEFNANRRTDKLSKLIVAFRKFAKAPKNC